MDQYRPGWCPCSNSRMRLLGRPPGTFGPVPRLTLTMDRAPSFDLPADLALADLVAQPAPRERAATMGNLDKVRYSHLDMIDCIISNPGISQNDLAARYGYTPGWISNVMASDAWQSALAARRAEICDPVLVATVEERFRGITLQSLKRLSEKLEAPQVSDNVVLKAVELGAKAMGLGGHAQPAAPPQDHLAQLANRLIDLQANIRSQRPLEIVHEAS